MSRAADMLTRWGYSFSKPNIKTVFIPDPGYVVIDVDLEQADAQVVAWESDCERLKQIFKDPTKDLHDENTNLIYGFCRDDIQSGTISDRNFTRLRKNTKGGVHGTNYRGKAPTIAKTLGITIPEAQAFQDTWFEKNPEILDWHKATEAAIIEKGYIENKFGFRRIFLERLSQDVLNEAQAWIPQSTVGNVINKGWMNIEERINGRKCGGHGFFSKDYKNAASQELIGKELSKRFVRNLSRIEHVKVLMQVHDSLVMMVRKSDLKHLLPDIRECMLVPIPYDEPLTIGVGNPEISDRSYGEVKPHTWDGDKI